MIRIRKGEDLVDVLQGDIELIKEIYYYSSADASVEIEPITEVEDDKLVCKLPSTELEKLQTGQSYFTAVLASEDSDFPDGEDTQIINEGLNIWLQK